MGRFDALTQLEDKQEKKKPKRSKADEIEKALKDTLKIPAVNRLDNSVFFNTKKHSPTPLPEKPTIKELQTNQAIPERAIARTPVRPDSKHIITRNCFEIYEDQMDSLRKLSFEEKMVG